MAKQKKKIEMKNLGKQHIKDALLRVHPFLRTPFREIKESEIQSEEVFKELFPNEDFKESELYKLHAIYVFQN